MPHAERGLLSVKAFPFTEAAVERALRAAADAGDGDGDSRRLWRDEGSRHGLYLRAGRKGGTYYRIHKQGGRKIKTRIGDATSMRVAKAREAALKQAGGDKTAAAPLRVRTDGPTVEKAWRAYLADARSGAFIMGRNRTGETTLKSYDELYRPHLRKRFGNKSLHYLARHVQAIHRSLADRPAAANRLLIVIKNLYTHAATAGYWAAPNPTIDPVRGRGLKKYTLKSRARYLSSDELRRVTAAIEQECDPWPDYFPLLLLTGVRKGTLRQATWAQFDLEGSQPVWSIPTTKNGDPLVLPLVPTSVAILKRRRKALWQGGRKPTSPWVFPRKGKPHLPIRDTREAWARILTAAEVEGARIHDIRRTHGTLATLGGATLQAVGRSLGHKSVQATQVYAIANITMAAQAAAIVEAKMLEAGFKK
jgi:integrase